MCIYPTLYYVLFVFVYQRHSDPTCYRKGLRTICGIVTVCTPDVKLHGTSYTHTVKRLTVIQRLVHTSPCFEFVCLFVLCSTPMVRARKGVIRIPRKNAC